MLEILEVELEDIDLVVDIANKIWNEYFPKLIGKEQVAYMLEKFQSKEAIKEQLNDGYKYCLVTLKGEIVGYYAYKIEKEENKLFLSKLYITKKKRSKGIAKLVIFNLLTICDENELEKIYLTCYKGNENSLGAYNRLGFEKADEVITDIGNGFVMDDYILEYIV